MNAQRSIGLSQMVQLCSSGRKGIGRLTSTGATAGHQHRETGPKRCGRLSSRRRLRFAARPLRFEALLPFVSRWRLTFTCWVWAPIAGPPCLWLAGRYAGLHFHG